MFKDKLEGDILSSVEERSQGEVVERGRIAQGLSTAAGGNREIKNNLNDLIS